MRPTNEKLATAILEAGKREFLSHGFQGASMRAIATTVGATTGAIYRYYADKEALFDAIVSEPAETLLERYREQHASFQAFPPAEQIKKLGPERNVGAGWMIGFIYDHFDAFKLIACSSAGTRWEGYPDRLANIEEQATMPFLASLDACGKHTQPLDAELVHIVSNMLFTGIFETVMHDMPRNKAERYMERLEEFYAAGWERLLNLPIG